MSVLGSLFLVTILTEKLNPIQYGELTLGLTLAGFFNQVVMGGVLAAIGRFYSIAEEKNEIIAYLNASREIMFNATYIVILCAIILVSGLFAYEKNEWITMTLLTSLYAITSSYNASLSNIQNAARQRASVAIQSGLDAWLKILFILGAFLIFSKTSTVTIIGFALSSLVFTAYQVLTIKKLVNQYGEQHLNNEKKWKLEIWKYSLPISSWGIFTWTQLASDRWALKEFGTYADVGLYSIVFQLGWTPISIVIGLAINYIYPIMYQKSGDATDRERNLEVHRLAWQITAVGVVITLIAFVTLILLHKWIFSILINIQYHSVSYLLPWIVLAGGLFASGQVLAVKLMSEMKTKNMTNAKIITAIFGSGLNIIGAAMFGIDGVVFSLVFFSLSYIGWMGLLANKC